MTQQRYVVHLPVCAASLDSTTLLARDLARSLTFLPEVDAAETTVSEEDHRGVRHRVFCDRLLDGRHRCAVRTDHPGECVPESARCAVPGGHLIRGTYGVIPHSPWVASLLA